MGRRYKKGGHKYKKRGVYVAEPGAQYPEAGLTARQYVEFPIPQTRCFGTYATWDAKYIGSYSWTSPSPTSKLMASTRNPEAPTETTADNSEPTPTIKTESSSCTSTTATPPTEIVATSSTETTVNANTQNLLPPTAPLNKLIPSFIEVPGFLSLMRDEARLHFDSSTAEANRAPDMNRHLHSTFPMEPLFAALHTLGKPVNVSKKQVICDRHVLLCLMQIIGDERRLNVYGPKEFQIDIERDGNTLVMVRNTPKKGQCGDGFLFEDAAVHPGPQGVKSTYFGIVKGTLASKGDQLNVLMRFEADARCSIRPAGDPLPLAKQRQKEREKKFKNKPETSEPKSSEDTAEHPEAAKEPSDIPEEKSQTASVSEEEKNSVEEVACEEQCSTEEEADGFDEEKMEKSKRKRISHRVNIAQRILNNQAMQDLLIQKEIANQESDPPPKIWLPGSKLWVQERLKRPHVPLDQVVEIKSTKLNIREDIKWRSYVLNQVFFSKTKKIFIGSRTKNGSYRRCFYISSNSLGTPHGPSLAGLLSFLDNLLKYVPERELFTLTFQPGESHFRLYKRNDGKHYAPWITEAEPVATAPIPTVQTTTTTTTTVQDTTTTPISTKEVPVSPVVPLERLPVTPLQQNITSS